MSMNPTQAAGLDAVYAKLHPAYEAEAIAKRFGAISVLKEVNMSLFRGEVLGLVGDNGAGKSTFIKVLTGFYSPDSGRLIYQGKPVTLGSTTEARQMGIQTVYQDLALINDLSVYQNMFLGREIKRWYGLNNKAMREQTAKNLDALGIRIPSVDGTVATLSGGQRQSIAVARAINSSPKVLIMDEPLAAMGVRESRMVLNLVTELKQRGDVAILIIAHNYQHIFEVCDRINFLSGGQIVYDVLTKDTTPAELLDLSQQIRLAEAGVLKRGIRIRRT
jgi:simple sugar transport system ATP-binding protein